MLLVFCVLQQGRNGLLQDVLDNKVKNETDKKQRQYSIWIVLAIGYPIQKDRLYPDILFDFPGAIFELELIKMQWAYKAFKTIVIFFLGIFFIQEADGQSMIIDSLQKQLWQAKTEREKLNCYLPLFLEKFTLPADTLMSYALTACRIAQFVNDRETELEAEYMIVYAYYKMGKNDTCLTLIEKQLKKKYAEPGLRNIQRKFLVTKGNILNIINESKKAQQMSFELLKDAETDNDKFAQVCALNIIGWSYLNLNDDSAAINWFQKGLDRLPANEERRFIELKNILESNIGGAYWLGYRNSKNVKQLDSAVNYTNRSVSMARKEQFLGILAFPLGNLALMINEKEKNYKQAEQLMKEVIDIQKKTGNPYILILDMAKMGELYLNSGQYKKGAAVCNEAIKKADSVNIRSDILWLYDLLTKNYKSAGMYKEYGDAMNAMMLLKDSINKVNSTREFFEIQARYEFQKEETTIARQKLKLIRRNIFIYGSALVLLTGGVAGWFAFRRYRRKQKTKLEKALEEEKKHAESAVKEAEDKERKRIAADLHDNLGVQANAILYNTELLKQEGTGKEELVGGLHDTAKAMLLNLRETLWAMKTADVSATDLWLRIIGFIKQMGRHYTIIKFTAEGAAPNKLIISSARALHIVMIVQEAVNNAVKHSGANQITVKSESVNGKWQLQVTDNGSGFDLPMAGKKKDSHGLINMKERAAAANLELGIEPLPEKGTCISIKI